MDDLSDKSVELLEKKREELVKIIQSFEILEKSKEWTTLKELVFDRELASIDRQLLNASKENPIDLPKIYKLQGERHQAGKYETNRYIEALKKQLEDINKKLK